MASFKPDSMNSSGSNSNSASFSPSGPGMGGPMGGGMGGQMGGMGGPMGSSMGMMNGMGPMGMMGMPGMGGPMGMGAMSGPMALQAVLRQQSMFGQQQTQLSLLLPVDLLQEALIPHGHLSEIANTLNINIQLGDQVASMRHVMLSGTVASNAMAAYFLQERSLQYMGGKMA